MVVRCDGASVVLPRGKQRTLLAVLLLRRGHASTADELAESLWAPGPVPAAAGVTVRNYVKRLRQSLGPAGRDRIVTAPGGYLIQVEPGELDIAVMEQELAAARASGRAAAWHQAAVHASAALGLWRGEPLAEAELPPLAAQEAARLTEMRLQAHELRIEADLGLARHAEAVIELPQLIAANPVREQLYALLMLALYRCGRRAEALDTYRAAHDILAEEIGADPGPELRALHQQILRDDAAIAAPRPGGSAIQSGLAGQVPRQLPTAVACFTGRDAELAELTSLIKPGPEVRAPAVVISVISGTAGAGKTALAVHWAHRVAVQFPDGQLYVNLRGYDPDQPVSAADALAGFLRALGVPGHEIPDGVEDRARLYRSRLAGRRVLVLLDNACDGEQVRPLLPGDPGCVAVITSRDVLAGLVAADGARRLELDVLPLADAVALLRSLIGGRVDQEPGALAELAELCARLPLALRIAAELAVATPAVSLVKLAAELASGQLDGLDAGEDRASVRAVFSWSVRLLPDDMVTAFALTGLHPGEHLDQYAIAALTGTTGAQARRVLSRLHRASLIQAAGPGRYGLHDLLRAYAREQATSRDTGGQCQQALTRLFDYYLAAAAAAMAVLFPAEAHHRPRIPGTVSVVPDLRAEQDARAWLDAERANLVTVVVHCAGQGWPRHATSLAGTLFRYLMTGSYLPEADTVYGHALQAARRSGDLTAEAGALNGLGNIAGQRGRYREAAGFFEAALERYRRCGDRAGQARVLHNLGASEQQLHNHRAAAGYHREAISAFADAGDSLGAARTLADLAQAETVSGSYDQAAEHLRGALPVLREAGDQRGEARALSQTGDLSLRLGQLAEARGFFEQALALYRRTDHRNGVAVQLYHLGEVCLRQADYRSAIGYLRQALELHRQTGDQYLEAETLRSLAMALRGAGQPALARAELEAALRLAADTGNTYQQAITHRDLAESHHAAGAAQHAHRHWGQALKLYTQLGAPDADQIRSRPTGQDRTAAAARELARIKRQLKQLRPQLADLEESE